MVGFSASDAALSGFRIVRERPRAALVWVGTQLVVSVCSTLILVQFFGPALTSFSAVAPYGQANPAQFAAALNRVWPIYLALLLFGLVFYPILYAAMNRTVLHPDEERFGYLRLGSDELRQFWLLLFAIGVGLLFNIVLCILIVILSVILLLLLNLVKVAGPGAILLMVVFFYVCLLGAWIFVYVRLSLASPMTFATRRVDLFGSWRLTRGRFWAIFGAYLIAWALGLLVMLLTFIIILAVTVVIGGMNGAATILHPDMTSLGAYLNPARMISLVISAIASALVWPVFLTPPAAIYKALTQTEIAAEF